MNPSNISIFYLFCFIFIACMGCAQNEAQQDFERKALMPPSGIQVIDANGNHPPNSESDSTDWNTAPNFTGLTGVQVNPAAPNPVSFGMTFDIVVNVGGDDVLNGFEVYAFQQPNNRIGPIFRRTGPIAPGTFIVRLKPEHFDPPNTVGNFGDTYRIIFLDGRGEIITYGDVLVQ